MKNVNGFTLLEAITSLIVLITLASLAIPSFGNLLRTQQLESSVQSMQTSLSLARQEAIKQGKSFTLAPTGRTWADGWMLFQDANRNGTLDSGELVFRSFPPLPDEVTLVGNGNVSEYIRYTPDGRATLVNGGFQAGTLTLCRHGTTIGYELILSRSGRVRRNKQHACP
ncbi:GspH/FimT family pseudopilin [Pseudomonas indica]|uniref:GspH/FimT family pseudopilin n=1 Tax=Pseudomonas indica TaxID=137658 RepID=UPI000BABAD4D|nr:hypothetical protein BZL42_18925 [Pseudomonas indica]